MSDLICRHASQICVVNCGLPEDQCACMSDTPDLEVFAVVRSDGSVDVWLDPAEPGIKQVRADTVQAQIDAAREAALQDAISHVRQALIDDAHKHASITTTRSSAMFTAEIIATNALSRLLPLGIRKGDQP